MIRLYLDENVRGSIYRGLLRRDVDVITAQEDGYDNTPDPLVLDRATELERVLFTHDDDLLKEAHLRQANNEPFAGLVYAHVNNISIGRCIDDLGLVSKAGEPQEYANNVQYLPL